MTIAFLLSLISINGLAFSLRRSGMYQKLLTVGLSISLFMIWLRDDNVLMVSNTLLFVFAVLAIFYGLAEKGLERDLRISVASIALITAIAVFFSIYDNQGHAMFHLVQIIPVILFIRLIILKWRQLPKELGFMLILSAISAAYLFVYLFQ